MVVASHIADIIHPESFSLLNPSLKIDQLCIDSRSVFDTHLTLFFAIKGPRHDGHQYIKEMYELGVRHFVVRQSNEVKSLAEANYWVVDDVVLALQKIAAFQRQKCHIPIIGITGSNGKTIVKEWLFHGLKESVSICKNPKSYNSQVGVPLSVWNVKESHQLGIFEAGISEPGEMQSIKDTIQPTIGVFTHLGSAHSQNFINRHQKLKEKLILFEDVESIFYPKDIELLDTEIKKVYALKKLYSWSKKDENAFVFIQKETIKNQCTEVQLYINKEKHTFQIPYIEKSALANIYSCINIWTYFGLSADMIQMKINSLPQINMRLELLKGSGNCTIINDAYSFDLDSLSAALDFQHLHNEHQNKWAILSELPLKTNKKEAYEQLSKILLAAEVKTLLLVGADYLNYKYLFTDFETKYFESTSDLKTHIQYNKPNKCCILVKGARSFHFEDIIQELEAFEHQTRLEIDLNALANNLNHYKSIIDTSTKIMVMVKAFAYGAGTYEIAQWLQHLKVDYLAVAFTSEAVALRKNGIQLPIMVMNAEPNTYEQLLENQLEPEIYSLKSLQAFVDSYHRWGLDKPCKIHIKLETGMNRLGFAPTDIPEIVHILAKQNQIKVASIFSHLAASDSKEHDLFTQQQIDTFQTLSEKICSQLPYPIMKHLANSAAISRFNHAHFDMVRLGIGLYGFSADPNLNAKLEVIAQLKTNISQIKEVEKGQTVGYNRTFTANKLSKIAILPIGYADGLRRGINLKSAYVLINGQKAPYVGNICMDMCMVDVSEISCKEGDETVIFGSNPTLKDISFWYDTIPYEIISNISQRVKRIYYKD